MKDSEIWDYIHSDTAFCDLTTNLQASDIDLNSLAKLTIFTRENLVFSGSVVAQKIAKFLDCEVKFCGSDGQKFSENSEIFVAIGTYANIHKVWKVTQIFLEYSCKISTYTHEMVSKIKKVNPKCELGTTRKNIPFAKEMCLNSVLAGGGTIHRLGLYDSVLFFKNHIQIYRNFSEFCEKIPEFKAKLPEKKIMVEVENFSDFKILLNYPVDVVQCDKMDISTLKECVKFKNENSPKVAISAAGGVNLKNCDEFASTGVDYIITSAPYMQGAMDLSSKILLLKEK